MIDLRVFGDFYVLEALRQTNPEAERLSSQLSAQLARLCRDYIFIAAMGEARHANSKAREFYYSEINGGSRGSAFKHAVYYDPIKNLPILIHLFCDQDWSSQFGGKSWGEMCKFALKYGEIPDRLFIDHAIDLHHNGGNLFNKEEISQVMDFSIYWKPGSFGHFLTWRLETEDILSGIGKEIQYLSLPVGRLVMKEIGVDGYLYSLPPIKYEPVEFGGKILKDSRSSSGDESDDDDDDDDDEKASTHPCQASNCCGNPYCETCHPKENYEQKSEEKETEVVSQIHYTTAGKFLADIKQLAIGDDNPF